MTHPMDPTPEEAQFVREFAQQIGEAAGMEEVAEDVLSGRVQADGVVALLAGMIDACIRTAFGPVVGMQAYDDFDPTERPLVADVTLMDGSRIRVTVEALPSE